MKNQTLDEKIIYECKPHWITLVWPGFLAAMTIMADFSMLRDGSVGFGTFIELLIFASLIFLIPWFVLKSNKLVLTDKRLYGKNGIIRVQKLSVPVDKVQYVNIKQGLLGKILGYSDIKINAITGTYVFKKQINSEEMQNAILNTMK